MNGFFRIHANIYKYECGNPSCACKVFMEYVMPPDVICFKRMGILKYLLVCRSKIQKDKELENT
ncbi:hypothetical protein D7V82_00315 [bacterium 1xD8-6]|nr:hypothetical protein D7V72_00315 [bacterium D16-36]RKI73611.1 hypothetical protein D7V82_00315 [bacterium 1xD8-6]